jgi:hypothetical protein
MTRQAAALGILLALALGADAGAQEQSGAALYDAACAACHGVDGKGLPTSVLGFDVPLPDFTDCTFSTVEADVDWMAIVHQGGPVRAFDRMMPAYGEALSEAQIQSVLDYVRGFCTEPAWPRGELNLPRPLVTEKAFPENEVVVTTSVAAGGSGSIGTEFLYEQRIGARGQYELVVPVELQESNGGSWERGLGDVAVAFKQAVMHSLRRGSILSVGGEVILPTGKETEGLGGGATVFEPFAAFGQILPRDSFLQVHGGFEIPVGHEGANEAFWRAAAGRTFVENRWGRAWTPMLELLGARELEEGAPTDWDLVPQLQVSLSRRQHILLNAGVRVPVANRNGRHSTVIAYLLWDWFDGGFFDGW